MILMIFIKILIIFVDMIADGMLSNKKLSPIVTELFIRDRKRNIFLVFISQSCFVIPKNVTLKSTYFHYENSKQMRASKNYI